MSDEDRIDQARELAAQAAATAAKLKVGAWESVQGMALSSIAISLAELARDRRSADDGV